MDPEIGFVLFGHQHLLTLGFLVIFGCLLLYPAVKWMDAARQREWAVGLASFMIVMEFLDRGYQVIVLNEAVKDNLPFHLCGIGVFLGAALLMSRNYRVFEVLYFWGLVGASQSVLTPDIEYRFPHFLYITFFLSHWMIIFAVLYMIIMEKMRPSLGSLWRAMAYLNVYMLLVIPINLILGTNYLFLCEKPHGETLLNYLGSWPWYLLSLEVVALLFFLVVYAPYLIHDLVARRRNLSRSRYIRLDQGPS